MIDGLAEGQRAADEGVAVELAERLEAGKGMWGSVSEVCGEDYDSL